MARLNTLQLEDGVTIYIGLSSDHKPTVGVPSYSRFLESDTGAYFYWKEDRWHQQVSETVVVLNDIKALLTSLLEVERGILEAL